MKRSPQITTRPRMDEKVQLRRGETLAGAFDRLATAWSLSVREDLVRLADGTPQRWFSPRRAQLLADGLVEIVFEEDGRWRGDRLADRGRAMIGEIGP